LHFEEKLDSESNKLAVMNIAYKHIKQNYSRTIVVGDIHGCYDELMDLLYKVVFSKNDVLISVGDMVDRGPKSWEVVNFFRDSPNAFSAMGNHERRLAGSIKGTSQPAWSQLHTLSKVDKNEEESYARYLESLPAVIETNHAVVTHARLNYYIDIDKQEAFYTCAVGGDQVVIETDENGIPYWFSEWEKTNGVDKPICMGHIGYDSVELAPGKLYALDTGVAKGGILTAVVFPDNKIIQVKAVRNHYEVSFSEWKLNILDKIENYKINKYLDLKNKDNKNEFDLKIISRFEGYLEMLDLEKRVNEIKEKLVFKFGMIPEINIEKGKYFKNIRDNLKGINNRLTSMILTKPFDQENLLKHFPKATIQDLENEFERLMKIE
jgi:serine/threonine protein phosphatase 1